jgi:hypothetical protein
MKKLITLVALVGCISAQAQSRFVAEGTNDTMFREGVATYSDNNGLTALSWFKYLGKFDSGTDRTLIQVHCDSRLFRIIRNTSFRNGRMISDTGENWSAAWMNPVPGTLTTEVQQICYTR